MELGLFTPLSKHPSGRGSFLGSMCLKICYLFPFSLYLSELGIEFRSKFKVSNKSYLTQQVGTKFDSEAIACKGFKPRIDAIDILIVNHNPKISKLALKILTG